MHKVDISDNENKKDFVSPLLPLDNNGIKN